MSEPSTYHEWPDMIEDCQERDEKLSDWDRQFLDSIEQLLSRGGTLTDKQRDTLDALWERVT